VNRSLSHLTSPAFTQSIEHTSQARPSRWIQRIWWCLFLCVGSGLVAAAQDPAPVTPEQPPAETPAPAAETPTQEPAKESPQPPAETPQPAPEQTPEKEPAEEKPAEEKPAEEKPVEQKTIEEKPADAPADENAAADSDATKPATETGSGLVDFQRDIAPVLASRCLECHGPKQAKNDFRVDDKDSMLGYIEAGDSSSSSLMTDYLITSDPDSLMPPASHGGPLPTAEIALIKLWIDEGAGWPEGATVVAAGEAGESKPAPETKKVMPTSMAARVWAFQGFLHPATVHFPIALLILGAFAAMGSYLPGWTSAEPIAKFCLFFGAIFSVVACLMGWSFATERGYGDWTSTEGEIFWHRWSGIILAVFSVILMLLSWKSNRSSSTKHIWKLGMLLAAVIVGLVGHQGGELTYGKAMYDRAFEYLLGEDK
jgi:uncharacterized membrane protein